MRKRLLGVLAAVLALLAFLWLRGRAPDPEPRAAAPARPPGARRAPLGRPGPLRLIPATSAEQPALASGACEGRVLSWSTGRGVEGAELAFASGDRTASIATGAEGAFRFVPPQPGGWTLVSVLAPRFLPFAPAWGTSPVTFEARPGVVVRGVTLFLTPAIDYTAVVLDPGGARVPGAEVELLETPEQALAPLRARFTSDARGELTFNAPDDALLEARHPAFDPGRARLEGAATVTHRLELRLRAKGSAPARALRIAGRVVDAAGRPAAFALVRAEPAGEGLHPRVATEADETGRFVLPGLDAGAHTVSAELEGHAPARAAAEAGAGELVLRLRPAAVLAGRVVGPDGAAVPSFTVAVLRRDGLRREVVRSASVLDPEGRFAVGDLEPGRYLVTAEASALAGGPELEAEAVAPPARPSPLTLTLGRGGVIVGQVISSADRRPLEHARVTLEGSLGGGSSAVPTARSAITGADGRFELGGVPPGDRSILVAAYKCHLRIVSGLRVAPGATVGPLVVDLTPTREGEQPTLEVVGIGVQLAAGEDVLRVERVLPGGGAADAGLVAGDAILSVDGVRVTELGFAPSMEKIRGPEGTSVRLGVRRAAGGEVELVVPRKRIRA